MELDKLIVRTARLEDLKVLREFEQGVIKAERPFDSDLKESDITYYDMEHLIEDVDTELIVIEYLGELIASGYAQIREAKPHIKYQHYSYLGFMYVKPTYRGLGLNGKVNDALMNWSRAKGILNVRLQVYDDNESAIRAYEKAGYHKRFVEMRHIIDK